MNLIINYPNDKNMLENEIAYIRAILMKKYIDDLEVKVEDKKIVIKKIKETLQKT